MSRKIIVVDSNGERSVPGEQVTAEYRKSGKCRYPDSRVGCRRRARAYRPAGRTAVPADYRQRQCRTSTTSRLPRIGGWKMVMSLRSPVFASSVSPTMVAAMVDFGSSSTRQRWSTRHYLRRSSRPTPNSRSRLRRYDLARAPDDDRDRRRSESSYQDHRLQRTRRTGRGCRIPVHCTGGVD